MNHIKTLIFTVMTCALSGCGIAEKASHSPADNAPKQAEAAEEDDITSAIKEDERKNDQITATRINDPGRKAALPALHLGTTTISKQVSDPVAQAAALPAPTDRRTVTQSPISAIFPRPAAQTTPINATTNLSKYLNQLSPNQPTPSNTQQQQVIPIKNDFKTQVEDAITFPKDQPPKDVVPAQVVKVGQSNSNTALKTTVKKKTTSDDGQTQHIDPATASLPDGMTQQDLQQVF